MRRVKDHRYLYRRGDVLWFRRAVPPGARAAFDGVREVQTSLRTSDLSKARHLLHRELQRFEERLSLATGLATPLEVITLSERRVPSKAEIDEVVRTWLDERLRGTPMSDYSTPEKVADARVKLVELEVYSDAVAKGLAYGATTPLLTTQWLAESLIERNGWRVEPGTDLERYLLRMAGRGQVEASVGQSAYITGEPLTVLDATFFPDQYRRDEERQRERGRGGGQPTVSFQSLFDGYAAESAPAPATLKVWKRQIEAFVSFLGHENANAITLANVVEWKEKLLTQPNAVGKLLSARTVRDSYLSALKTVLRWGCENGKIASNPAASVRVRGPRGTIERERGLSDVEAMTILTATLVPASGRLSLGRARAQRWVPWLCAYTGARVNEITQLRAGDVKQIDGIWTIRISPEAGSVKNGRARTVPLHPHLLDQGFPAVASALTGPIFYDPTHHRGGSDGNPQFKNVGEHLARWVRSCGVTDPRVQPNHGWRHRFKTQARNVNMNVEVRDTIQGHAPRTEGEAYGDTSPAAALREIVKLPRYIVRGL